MKTLTLYVFYHNNYYEPYGPNQFQTAWYTSICYSKNMIELT